MTTSFGDALASCIATLPEGRVVSCGALARALGDVRAAKAVAQWVREHPDTDPDRKVVRADGHPILTHNRAVSSSLPDRFVDAPEAVPILAELRARQAEMEPLVVESDRVGAPRTLGGVDVAYVGDRAFAAAVLVDANSLDVLETRVSESRVDFPYIPSYLAFREFPAIERVIRELRRKPDVLFVDGHGRLHPTLFGFACFAGVSLDLPTIGIAKHPLTGSPMPSKRTEMDAIPVEIGGRVRGYAWRAPGASRALYVSVGHRITLDAALMLARRATIRRYPEPLRIADRMSKEGKAKKNGERSASGQTAARRPPAHGRQGI